MVLAKIPIDVRKLLHNALLVDVASVNEYKNGEKTGNIAGYKYTVILPDFAYEKINVKILGKQQMEVFDEAIPVKFEAVEAKFYCIDGRYDISVSAEAIMPAKGSATGKQEA